MSVMPVGEVLEMASTGARACCASGSAAVAVVESVGPMITLTLSWLMNFWKTLMPCSLLLPSSSKRTSSFTPPGEPCALTWSAAAWMPFFCVAPYTAAGPVMLSAAPTRTEAPPPAACVDPASALPPPLHAATATEAATASALRHARCIFEASCGGWVRSVHPWGAGPQECSRTPSGTSRCRRAAEAPFFVRDVARDRRRADGRTDGQHPDRERAAAARLRALPGQARVRRGGPGRRRRVQGRARRAERGPALAAAHAAQDRPRRDAHAAGRQRRLGRRVSRLRERAVRIRGRSVVRRLPDLVARAQAQGRRRPRRLLRAAGGRRAPARDGRARGGQWSGRSVRRFSHARGREGAAGRPVEERRRPRA